MCLFVLCALGKCLFPSYGYASQAFLLVDCYAFSSDSITRYFTCNWILSSMEIQRRSRFTPYVICYCHPSLVILTPVSCPQLVLLNGGGLIGRLSAGFIAPYIGVARLLIISTAVCSILMIGMIGLNRVPTVVVIGTIYGYFAGTCQSPIPYDGTVQLNTGRYRIVGTPHSAPYQ